MAGLAFGQENSNARIINTTDLGADPDPRPVCTDANHHPVAVVNGDACRRVLEVSASSGSSEPLTAVGSSDPDGGSLAYSWFFYKEPSSYPESVKIENGFSASATVSIPAKAGGKNMHIILEVHDDGAPNLYAYRRVIINVK